MSIPTIDDSFRYCENLTFGHYENFPVASFLLPKEKRKYIASIYAFARIADDFADEPGMDPKERMLKLSDWGHDLEECYAGNAKSEVFVALRETSTKFEIPKDLFLRLLAAFKSDVTTNRYETFDDVLKYCANSANPVGRLVLLLFGYKDERLNEYSDHVCTALQLANFWQDVSVDLDKDRMYLPLEDLRKFGVSKDTVSSRTHSVAFHNLMKFQVSRTREFFERGRPLLEKVGKDLRMELRLTWLGGMQILRKIEKNQYNVLKHRPALSKGEKMILLLRSFLNSGLRF